MSGTGESRKVKIPWGSLTKDAEEFGVSVGHLSHYLKGRPSARLDERFRAKYGVTGPELEVDRRKTAEELAADEAEPLQ